MTDNPYRWSGAYTRGARRTHRERLHLEALARNASSPHDTTRAHREGRCDPDACSLSTDPEPEEPEP